MNTDKFKFNELTIKQGDLHLNKDDILQVDYKNEYQRH